MAEVSIVLKGVDHAKGVLDGVSGALDGLAGIAGGVLTAGLAAGAAGLTALGAGLSFSFAQAIENEQIQAQLAQTIKSTGGAAGLTADAANALAQQFSHLAGGSDDAILAIETIGLRAGTISADEMPAFIQSVLDLGTVMGDTAGAATLLARAQDDPEAAFKRIERATGAYDSALEEQIKTLVAAGDNAGAVELIMGKLAETTGGAAQAQAETLAGKWELLKGTLGEAAETIGGPLLDGAQQLFDSVIAPAIPLITEFGNALAVALEVLLEGDIGGAFDALMEFDGVRAVFQGLGLDLSTAGGIVETFVENVQAAIPNLIAAVQPIIDAAGNVLKAFQDSLPMVQTYFADMVSFIIGQVNTLSPTLITNISTTLNSLATFWREHGDEVMGVVNFAFRVITVTVGGALTWLSGIVAATMQIINGDWSGAWQTISDTAATFMNSVLSIVGTDLATFTQVWTDNWNMAVLIVTTVWQQIQDAVSAKLMELTSGIQTAIIGAANWLQEFLPQFVALGGRIIESIVSGVVGAAINLANAVASAVSGALAATGIGGGGGGGVTSNTSTTNNTSSVTNNYYGYGGDVAAGQAQAMAGSF